MIPSNKINLKNNLVEVSISQQIRSVISLTTKITSINLGTIDYISYNFLEKICSPGILNSITFKERGENKSDSY